MGPAALREEKGTPETALSARPGHSKQFARSAGTPGLWHHEESVTAVQAAGSRVFSLQPPSGLRQPPGSQPSPHPAGESRFVLHGASPKLSLRPW